jgi:hypothetical protein
MKLVILDLYFWHKGYFFHLNGINNKSKRGLISVKSEAVNSCPFFVSLVSDKDKITLISSLNQFW